MAFCLDTTCSTLFNSRCVYYEAEALPYIGISTNDSLQTALQKIEVVIEDIIDGGGSGGSIWGSITGTITNQTDLITYLSTNYTPQSRTLTINGTSFDLSANRTWNVGTITGASNGLTEVGNDIELGGSLTDNIIIDGLSTHQFTFNDIFNFEIVDGGSTYLQYNAGALFLGGSTAQVQIAGGNITANANVEIELSANNAINIICSAGPITSFTRHNFTTDSTWAGFNLGLSNTDPSNTGAGAMYYNTASGLIRWANGTIWQSMGSINGTGSVNRIPYWTSASTLSVGPYWDNTNTRLGVGQSPNRNLDVSGSTDTYLRINAADGLNPYVELTDGNSTTGGEYWQIYKNSSHNLRFNNGSDRFYFNSTGSLGVGGAPSFDLDVIKSTSSPVVSRVRNTGTGEVDLILSRSGGTASEWAMYIPTGNTELRFYNAADRIAITSGGALKILTAPVNDDTETSVLVRQSDGEIQTRNVSTIGISGTIAVDQVAFGSGSNTITGSASFKYTSAGGLNILGTNNSTVLLVEDDAGNNIIHAYESAGLTRVDITTSGNLNIGTTGTGDLDISSNDIISLTSTNQQTLSSVSAAIVVSTAGQPRLSINNNGSWTIDGSTGTAGQVLTSNGSGSTPSWQDASSGTSGTYTPTSTNVANVDSSTPALAHYTRVGNEVSVFGSVSIDPTTGGGSVTLGLSLPIASNLAATTDLAGLGGTVGGTTGAGNLFGDAVNNRATLAFTASGTSSEVWYYSYMYTVI